MELSDVLQAFNALPANTQADVMEAARKATAGRRFVPLPGPQTEAYLSDADVLLYGGAAGGGKSFLAVGLSQDHQRSIVFRRESGQTDGLEAAGKELFGSAGFNGTDLEWSWDSGRSLKLAGMKEPDDWIKHAGRERDLIVFDEAGEFIDKQVASLLAWNRGPRGQRCRVVLASNPPRTSDGVWMLTWFAPWLDQFSGNPAKPGELRWAIMRDGKPEWRDSPEPVEVDGETYIPLSFTFIPASLKDNPYRNTAEYRAKLNSLPEPLRSQLLHGMFGAATEDDEWQIVPSAWVDQAIARWTPAPAPIVPQCAIGCDPAQGGKDRSVLAIRHDGWYAPLLVKPGSETPNGVDIAGWAISRRRDSSVIVMDVGGGWGADAYGHLTANDVDSVAYMGIKESVRRTRDGQLRFTNIRTEAYWGFREALDPEQAGGSPIMLPNDRELRQELCAVKFEVTARGIKAEPKDKVKDKLGRSPDKADAVVMAWYAGAKAADSLRTWEQRTHRGLPPVKVNLRAPRGERRR